MALNPTKSDAILFGTPQRLKSVSGLTSVNVADSVIQLSGSVKILGATLDPSLTMGPHAETLSKSCFHHIRSFKQIRSSMDHSTAVSVALALVSSRLCQLYLIQQSTEAHSLPSARTARTGQCRFAGAFSCPISPTNATAPLASYRVANQV